RFSLLFPQLDFRLYGVERLPKQPVGYHRLIQVDGSEVGRATPRPEFQLHDSKERKKMCRPGPLAQQRQQHPDPAAPTHLHHPTDHKCLSRCPACPPLPEGVPVEAETEQHTPMVCPAGS
ncbi:hypothetical protein XENOCAPTIV_005775, partial [Xenoophorus captivus]